MTDSIFLASIMIFVLVTLLPILFHLTKYLGSKSDNVRKNEPVEGGIRLTHKDSFDGFNVKFFLVGIIFLIFDVEILFMFPWGLNLRELGLFALLEMFVFMTLLIGGLVYVYKSGMLKWT
ncbi:NADH-quinone oxidoreductase subunit A [Sulfurimonas aquatica]|uniref:NADH-quinone oxidoreductase subunit n=1 Tax=Sulfurimonas aquatica TaxID=2672570 RepID=A0A975AZE4_9BACT|nr:NADH-quinone oxidoreductase subunit A [Sulfurimonas aquatica]QSZ41404.1 NADH-quinone oxidoreductase subunit A [Sulfurimonas aquatica]